MAEIRSRVAEARELGLIKPLISTNANRIDLLKLLEDVVNSSTDEILITSETISYAIEELLGLQKEEFDISNQLTSLRKRFIEMSELKESTVQYQGALQIQRDRLQSLLNGFKKSMIMTKIAHYAEIRSNLRLMN